MGPSRVPESRRSKKRRRRRLGLRRAAMSGKRIGLVDFVESVKLEILDYQARHRGEPALFEIEKLELEVSLATTVDASGGVKVFVVEWGAKGSQDCAHKATLSLKIPEPEKPTENKKGRRGKKSGGSVVGG